VSHLTRSRNSKLPALKIRRPLPKKPFVKSRTERKPWLLRREVRRRLLTRTRMLSKKLKTRLLKKPKKRLPPLRRPPPND